MNRDVATAPTRPFAGDPRAALARAQAALAHALARGGPPPRGFDAADVSAAAGALARKRARAVAKAWPALAAALGSGFPRDFAAYAAGAPIPQGGDAREDGRAFARALALAGRLPDAARIEALRHDLRSVAFAGVRVAWLRERNALAIGLRIPWLGARVLLVAFPAVRGRRCAQTRSC
jgi:hypothetical protein